VGPAVVQSYQYTRSAAGPGGGALWHSGLVRWTRPAVPLLALAVATVACGGTTPDDAHVRRIQAERAVKDAYFREAPDSPMPAAVRDLYLPLSYYEIDLDYAAPAQLRMAPAREPVVMPTSTGRLREMELIGTLEFTLKGEPLQLAAFVDAGTTRVTRLFVPFADETSGHETYAAGRYMDLDPTSTGIYIVDFNVAYHPYCYFNAEYDCPFPPPGNRLPVAVRAGERMGAAAPALDTP
jgi:uncharacterized protein